jgi:hypothetical protein
VIRRLRFEYERSQVYLRDSRLDDGELYLPALDDAQRRGGTVGIAGGLVDLFMPEPYLTVSPLTVAVLDAEPPLDDGWEHVVEFPLDVPSGRLVIEGAGSSAEGPTVEVPPAAYHARWSGRELGGIGEYRLELWPRAGDVEVVERKRSERID